MATHREGSAARAESTHTARADAEELEKLEAAIQKLRGPTGAIWVFVHIQGQHNYRNPINLLHSMTIQEVASLMQESDDVIFALPDGKGTRLPLTTRLSDLVHCGVAGSGTWEDPHYARFKEAPPGS